MEGRESQFRGGIQGALSYLVESLTQVLVAHVNLAQKEILDGAHHHARLAWRLAVWVPCLFVGILSLNAALVIGLQAWLPLWASAGVVGAFNLVGPLWSWFSVGSQAHAEPWFRRSHSEITETFRAVTKQDGVSGSEHV